MKVTVEYGRGNVYVNIPKSRLAGILEPKKVTAIPNLSKAIKKSLDRPIAGKPLKNILTGAKNALVLTVDHTRPSPAPLLEPVLNMCDQMGVEATICIATGRHRQLTNKELKKHLGLRLLKKYNVIQHDPFNRSAHKYLGKTKLGTEILVNKIIFKYDRIIGAGIIEPSYLAGFSGGRKLIMPGIAFHSSIDNNHFYLTDVATKIGRLHGNPVSDDAEEFAHFCPYHFICYTINGPNDEPVSVISGDPYKAHQIACKKCKPIYSIKTKKAPIVICSAGGYPYDCDLVQGKKAIVPATEAVQCNGVIILLADCPEGLGAEKTFISWLENKTPAQVVKDVRKREMFNLGAHGANILAKPIVEKNATVILVTRPKITKALANTYIKAVSNFNDAWQLANLLCQKSAKVLVLRKARRLICD